MLSRLSLAAAAFALLALTGCNRESDTASAPASAAAVAVASTAEPGHPLRGVVVDLLPAQSALMVKHEDIPGFMRAMTMAFKVEPEVLSRAVKGQAVEAVAFKRGGEFWLREVKLTAP